MFVRGRSSRIKDARRARERSDVLEAAMGLAREAVALLGEPQVVWGACCSIVSLLVFRLWASFGKAEARTLHPETNIIGAAGA